MQGERRQKMILETELNRKYAEKLSALIMENPGLRVIAWIDTEGIYDDYSYMAGNLGEPCIEELIIGNEDDAYHAKEESPYDDCLSYYGSVVDDWTDEEIEEKAKKIPWERVICVKVSAT
jgi:hypothetical protein